MNPSTSASDPVLFNWLQSRSTGVLMHPTSLPGDQGIGVLDSSVDAWLGFLHAAGIKYWQVCPLGPTGYGDSPYQCFSVFAGNPYLIDLQPLVEAGLLAADDLAPLKLLNPTATDFGGVYYYKFPLLHRAYEAFAAAKTKPALYGSIDDFRSAHAEWLESYALFQALKDHFKGLPWWDWPVEYRSFDSAKKQKLSAATVQRGFAHSFFQYLFFGQWAAVRAKARLLGIEIIGDAPIFVAADSADVWANPSLFQLDPATGRPTHVAGVPPDYFSADGQLWGNPLYDWDAHARDDYAWWLSRLRANFALCDVLRIDHFRAFDTYWSIPAGSPTAKTGHWRPGPGLAFFQKIHAALLEARMIAEDLGDLTPSVLALRDATGLPGMAILQFAYGGEANNAYLPHHHRANCIIYPGTHDNDTSLGWYATAPEKTRDHVRRYHRIDGREIAWDFIRASYASPCHLAVIPLQDLFSLGSAARFNTPGQPAGNWQWRTTAAQLARLQNDSAAYLHELGDLYGRLPAAK